MDEAETRRRAEISRRLKAARWLAGGTYDVATDPKVRAISPKEMAELEPLRANGITANAIGEMERLDRGARPMELRVIAEALGLPADYFDGQSLSSLGEDVGPPAGELRRELRGGQPNRAEGPGEGGRRDPGLRSGGRA